MFQLNRRRTAFPVTSVTLIARIRDNGGRDDVEWTRFWDRYSRPIRNFAVRKCGEEKADDILMTIFGKLVKALRSGQYTPQKGRFHSYLTAMIVNETAMAHRKDVSRAVARHVSLECPVNATGEDDARTIGDVLRVEERVASELDDDWRQSILDGAREHVLMRTALSDRDRLVYRACAMEGRPIAEVAAEFRISRNLVSQIMSRINQRIVAAGKELLGQRIDSPCLSPA